MKWRTENRVRTVPRTIDGTTHQTQEHYKVDVPVPPADWDVIAVRAAVGLVLALTGVTIVWSTYAIGQLLGGGMGYAAATPFDAAWIVCLILEWLARYEPDKRRTARIMGWLLLLGTMGAIFWHGWLEDSIELAVVGAAVSLVAKILWLGVLRHIDRDLSDVDRQWVLAEKSRTNAQLAVAGARRQAARAEQRAAAELLAAEEIRERGHRPAPQRPAPPHETVRPIEAPAPAAIAPQAPPAPEPEPQHPAAAAPHDGAPHSDGADEAPRTTPPAAPSPARKRPASGRTDVELHDPLDIGELSKAAAVRHIDTVRPGLDAPAVAQLLAQAGHPKATPGYVRNVRSRSGGTGQYL